MANIILPLVYYLLTIGKTIDIRNYEANFVNQMFNGDDIVETSVNALNSTYYVLPDEKIPYSTLGAPIDLLLGIETNTYSRDMLDFSNVITSRNFDTAAILLVTEYRTIDRSIKENANLISGWQKAIPESSTHYVDKMLHGGKCLSLITIRSTVTGDVQIFRRILKDIMGTSGRIGEDMIDLWKKAMKTLKGSEDVRGDVYVSHNVMARQVDLPSAVYINIENLLRYLNEFTKYVSPPNPERNQVPLYVSLKPLRDLDERYDSLEKNVEGERYMVKLFSMANDLEYVYKKLSPLLDRTSEEDEKKFDAFESKIRSVRETLRNLMYTDLSIYKDIDLSAFKSASEKYQKGLDNSTENYFMAYNILREEIAFKCEKGFLKPARGVLKVRENEVVQKEKIEGGLEKCQDLCVEDKRCRAVGYAESNKQCLIYYRSTSSATISIPKGNEHKIYDRRCG